MKFVELDDYMQTCLVCAVRYALGRRSYMPSLVQDVIKPLIPDMSNKALSAILRDLTPVNGDEEYDDYFGDENIDKPMWIAFRSEVKKELDKRKRKQTI